MGGRFALKILLTDEGLSQITSTKVVGIAYG